MTEVHIREEHVLQLLPYRPFSQSTGVCFSSELENTQILTQRYHLRLAQTGSPPVINLVRVT